MSIEQNVLYKKQCNRYLRRKRRDLVTICIASICEALTGNPRIVFCADRLVTDANGLTFEQGTPKILQFLPQCLIMNAGDAFRGDAIIRDTFYSLSSIEPDKQESMSIKEIAELVKKHYDNHFTEAIETDIFKSRGLMRQSFYLNIKSYPDWFAMIIDNQVNNYNFDVAFIILGFDINQITKVVSAQLYELGGNGELKFVTQNGFSMVGIGSYQSLPEITKEPYSMNISLSDCIIRMFWAKKLSERMVSVGKDTTDMGIHYVERDQNDKVVAKNTLLTDDFKKKLLADAFEKQKQMLKQTTDELHRNIDEVFQGKRAIGQTTT